LNIESRLSRKSYDSLGKYLGCLTNLKKLLLLIEFRDDREYAAVLRYLHNLRRLSIIQVGREDWKLENVSYHYQLLSNCFQIAKHLDTLTLQLNPVRVPKKRINSIQCFQSMMKSAQMIRRFTLVVVIDNWTLEDCKALILAFQYLDHLIRLDLTLTVIKVSEPHLLDLLDLFSPLGRLEMLKFTFQNRNTNDYMISVFSKNLRKMTYLKQLWIKFSEKVGVTDLGMTAFNEALFQLVDLQTFTLIGKFVNITGKEFFNCLKVLTLMKKTGSSESQIVSYLAYGSNYYREISNQVNKE